MDPDSEAQSSQSIVRIFKCLFIINYSGIEARAGIEAVTEDRSINQSIHKNINIFRTGLGRIYNSFGYLVAEI